MKIGPPLAFLESIEVLPRQLYKQAFVKVRRILDMINLGNDTKVLA